MKALTRRDFLETSTKAAAGTAAALAGMDAIVSAQEKKAAPSDRIGIALVGCGGQGTSDLGQFLKFPNVDCVALADVDAHRLDETAQTVKEIRGKAPERYGDFRKILDRKDVQAVIVAAPDHWHALATIFACQAGKDVYVEKPLATSIAEGRAMVAAARRYDRVVQVGTQQRSAAHFKDAVDVVRSGELGRVRLVRAWAYLDWKGSIGAPADRLPPEYVDYDLWLGPAPARPFNPDALPPQFPLVLGLFGRPDDRLGRPHGRRRQMGHGRGTDCGVLGRRKVRLSRGHPGDAGHPAGHCRFPGILHGLGGHDRLRRRTVAARARL